MARLLFKRQTSLSMRCSADECTLALILLNNEQKHESHGYEDIVLKDLWRSDATK